MSLTVFETTSTTNYCLETFVRNCNIIQSIMIPSFLHLLPSGLIHLYFFITDHYMLYVESFQ